MILNYMKEINNIVTKAQNFSITLIDKIITFVNDDNLFCCMFSLFCAINSVIIIYWFVIYFSEYRKELKEPLLKDIPEEATPEEVEFLFTKKISVKSILATILSIINKKGLLINKGLELGSKKEDITLAVNDNNLKDKLTEKEITLRDEIVKILGKDNVISINSLNKIKSDKTKCQKLTTHYYIWHDKTLHDLTLKNIFDKNKREILFSFIYLLIGVIFIAFYYNFSHKVLWLLPSFIAIIICSFIPRRSKKYTDIYYKWLSFRRYLFSLKNLPFEKLPEQSDLSKFLVYAYPLGCHDYMYNMIAKKEPNHINMKDTNNSDMFDLFNNKRKVLLAIWTTYLVALETKSVQEQKKY